MFVCVLELLLNVFVCLGVTAECVCVLELLLIFFCLGVTTECLYVSLTYC